MMKHLRKVLHFLISPFVLGLLVTFAIISASRTYYAVQHDSTPLAENSLAHLIRQIHEKTIDWRLRDRGQRRGSDRVAVLAIDERSIEQEGRWPWPRDKMAKLVEKTLGYGARSISFDIIFSEEDNNSSIPTLNRLRKALGGQSHLTPDIDQMIGSELQRGNFDQIFADTIKTHADHLVLGSYYEEYSHENLELLRPHADFCIDALFERKYESRYWKKEAIPLAVTDASLDRLGFPGEIKDHLAQYFTQLEVTAANSWFERHKEKSAHLDEALKDLNTGLPPEAYPGLVTLWLNQDSETMIAMLGEVKPELANPDGAERTFTAIASAFTKQERADLLAEIRISGEEYCSHFLSDQDDLLSLDAYKKKWGDGPDTQIQFDELSWGHLWAKLQGGPNPDRKTESLEQAIERFTRQSMTNAVLHIARSWINIPLIGTVTKHSGYFNTVQDSDGAIRRSVLLARRGHNYLPSLALKTFLLDQGDTATVELDLEKNRLKIVRSLEVKNAKGEHALFLPVDRRGHLMINYAGGTYMFPHISAGDILANGPTAKVSIQEQDARGQWQTLTKDVDKARFLKDKMLIVGATATGVYDLRVTPFEENYPGVETHANVLSNLMIENARAKGEPIDPTAPGFLRTHPDEERLMWKVLLGLGTIMSALLAYFGSVAGLGITGLVMGGIYAIDRFWLFRSGIVATTLFPMAMVFVNFITLTFYKYFTEERKKRELKGTFEKYVSPAIVAEVLSDPSNIELGGKKMELTVMFSDVRGFTTISEKLDPRALSDLLNSYLTPMTDLVFTHKGTLDKYMGDAIMAFWGAPIHFKDHAKHACRCALAMLVKLKELQAAYKAKGLPEIDIGIGLNTGEMSVGNMGSETVRSYTVMGDAVNLGSRLEGINKQYGTRIIISEFTREAIKDSFVTREVDWVRVKGKAQPVRIFELVAEGHVPEKTATLLRLFDEGFRRYHEKEFEKAIEAFTQALHAQPDDACSQLYLERCQDYLAEPPPADWDGVYNMKSK